jgi:hypothetical protein
MNKKKQYLITGISLAMLTGIGATGTALAWFSTLQSVSVSFSNAEIVTTDNDLLVSYVSSRNSVMSNETTGSELTLTGLNQITDISGDGISFHKPEWTAYNSSVAYDISEVGQTVADGYYIDFTINVSRSSVGSGGMTVYLGSGTNLVPSSDPAADEDMRAIEAARLAVINYDDGSILTGEEEVAMIYAPEIDGESSYQYLKPNASESAYGFSGYELAVLTNVKDDAFVSYNTYAEASAASAIAIADLTGAVESEDVTFRAWIEGTDAEALNSAIGGVFSIELNLYGLTVS